MGTSTTVLTGAAVVLTVAAAAIGFFAGRASVPDDHASVIAERTATATFPKYEFAAADEAAASNPRAQLLHALQQPPAERNRAIRVAMNAWLAADGATAIMAVRGDPELRALAARMTQFALFAYPELFVDDPSLLEGIPDGPQSVAMAARAMAMFDPDAARGMVNTRLSGSVFGRAVLKEVDRIERGERDPRAELESILAGQDKRSRIERLFGLVVRVAADDPVAAAELIEDLPGSLMGPATQALVAVWSSADPEEAARWLAQRDAQVSGESWSSLAQGWGRSDFEAANAFADTLTGGKRDVFLTGLASATGRMSNDDVLAWVSRYEDDPAYPNLMMSVAQRFASRDPEAAVALIDGIGNESVRGHLLPMVAGMWAQDDAESAFDWARGLAPGRARDQAIASIAPSMMGPDTDFDMDRAIDLIKEIEDPDVRKGSVRWLLRAVESDDEALRLGRDHGFDHDAVLELREGRIGMRGPGSVRTISTTFGFTAATDEE